MSIRRLYNLDGVDQAQLRALAEQFFREAKLEGSLNWEFLRTTMGNAMTQGYMALWIAENEVGIYGVLGGMVTPNPFTGHKIAVETFWFVDASQRRGLTGIRMMNYFIEWAMDQGAVAVHMGFMHNIHPEHVAHFYTRQGFNQLETVYQRKLCNAT